jgi:hypothetical protein
MRRIAIVGLILISFYGVWGQTSTSSTGNWSDPSIWSAGVPTTTSTANVNNTITIDQNVSVTSGTFSFGVCAAAVGTGCTSTSDDVLITDEPGGNAYTLTATGGTILIKEGITTFEGTATLDNVTLTIYRHATLILGATQFLNQSNITIYGTLIINGNLANNNNGTGTFNIQSNGLVQVNGNYEASTGNVDVTGGGDLFTTGTLVTNGSSDIFGSTNDCTTGPCSGQNLCSFSNTVASSMVLCAGSDPGTLTCTTSGGTPTYQWQYSASAAGAYTSITAGGGYNTATLDITPTTIDATGYSAPSTPPSSSGTRYYRCAVTSGGCTGYSAPVGVTLIASNSWVGTTSDWHTTSNWCNNTVPVSGTSKTIAAFPTGSGKFYPIVSTATANINNLTIASGASVTVNGQTLNIFGNLTTTGSLTSNSSATVAFVGTSAQTISGASFTQFNNLTINNASGVSISGNNRSVAGALTLSNGNLNLNGFTLTIGTSAASTGSVSRTSGYVYGGFIQRYFGTTATALANGLFPIGSTADYRPFSVGYTSALTTGGYVRLSHTGTQYTFSNVSFFDDPPTNSATVLRRSDSFWTATTNGIAGGGTSLQIEAGGTSFSNPATLTDFRIVRSADVVGSNGTSSGTALDPRIQRTGLTAANLANTFYVGSINLATPLPVTLSEFDATLTKEGVALNWSTLTEVNADYFDIEKSINGFDFQPIGRLAAHGPNIGYSFLDQNTQFSRAYYRLKNVDLAIGQAPAKFEYSKVISVEKQGFHNYGVLVYPNPVENKSFTIQVGDGNPVEGQVMLCDLSGRTISKELRNNVQGEYQISDNLQSGFYFLKVYTSTIRQTVKIVIK